jgi:hypothetical protein
MNMNYALMKAPPKEPAAIKLMVNKVGFQLHFEFDGGLK